MTDSASLSLSEITLVVPMFNACKTIGRLLNSCVPLIDSGMSVVVIDDGSNDGCHSVVSVFSRKFQSVKLIRQKNRGRSAARNLGISLCSTTWVAFADSDDELIPDGWLSLVKALSGHIIEEEIIQCNFVCAKTNSVIHYPDFSFRISDASAKMLAFDTLDIKGYEPKEFYWYEGGSHAVMSAWTKLYRLSFLNNTGLLFPQFSMFEDALFNLQCLLKCDQVLIADVPIYTYYIDEGSTSRSHSFSSYVDSRSAIDYVVQLIEQSGLSKDFEPYLQAFAVNAITNRLSYSMSSNASYGEIVRALKAFCSSKTVVRLLTEYLNALSLQTLHDRWLHLRLKLLLNERFISLIYLCKAVERVKLYSRRLVKR